ncbi:unnamed protein product, partial [marine sediment metagenome]
HAGRFNIFISKIRDDSAHGSNRSPFYLFIVAAKQGKKRIDYPSSRQSAQFIKYSVKIV